MTGEVLSPLQPMAVTSVQENFRGEVDHVRTVAPDCPVQFVERRLNTRLRQVMDMRMWGGLLQRGYLWTPAEYTTGLVNFTAQSNVLTGVGTAWPVSDKVNTSLSVAIAITGEYIEVTPASMSGIELGDFLLIDSGLGTEEVLLVFKVTDTTFFTKCKYAHTAGIGTFITESSFVRRQIRRGLTTAMNSIKAVKSATSLIIDLPWGHSTAASQGYQIVKSFHNLGPNLKMVWSVVNNAQGWRLKLNMPQEVVNVWDSWRSAHGWSFMLLDLFPDEIGRMQYELYPVPTTEQGLPYLAYCNIGNMVNDEDTPPPCIPSHMLVNGALSDCLLWNRKSPYYDPVAAAHYLQQFKEDFFAAVLVDDSTYQANVQWSYSHWPFVQMGAAWGAEHAESTPWSGYP